MIYVFGGRTFLEHSQYSGLFAYDIRARKWTELRYECAAPMHCVEQHYRSAWMLADSALARMVALSFVRLQIGWRQRRPKQGSGSTLAYRTLDALPCTDRYQDQHSPAVFVHFRWPTKQGLSQVRE